MNQLRTASRLTLICSLHASQSRADSCLTHYWTNSTQRPEWGQGKSHAPQILSVFHSYSAHHWAPTTTGLTMYWVDRKCRREPLSLMVPRQSKPNSPGPLAWATSILPLGLITVMVMDWHHIRCRTVGDESLQWHKSGWQRAVTLRGWIIQISTRFVPSGNLGREPRWYFRISCSVVD